MTCKKIWFAEDKQKRKFTKRKRHQLTDYTICTFWPKQNLFENNLTEKTSNNKIFDTN